MTDRLYASLTDIAKIQDVFPKLKSNYIPDDHPDNCCFDIVIPDKKFDLTKYIEKLIDLGILEKSISYNVAKKNNTKEFHQIELIRKCYKPKGKK